MPIYQVLIKHSAEKELDALQERIYRKIAAKISDLKGNPRPPGCKRLQKTKAYRIRIGDYRVLYTINDLSFVVTVYAVGHRSDAYR